MESIGVDLGATSIKAGVVDSQGAVSDIVSRPTTPQSPDDIVTTVVELVEGLRGSRGNLPVGIAVAAFLNPDRSAVVFSPNIAWEHRPLKREWEAALGCEVIVENDANAAGWAEYCVGAAKESATSVMFTLGTGIGGAVVDRGQLMVGARGMAAELGHLVVDFPGPRCGCGQRGCVEAVSSATALLRDVRDQLGDQSIGMTDIEGVLAEHDDLRDQLFARMARGVARAIIQVHAVVDPEVVVLGGGIIERTGEVLLELIRDALAEEAKGRRSELAEIRAAHCGNRAGIIGAGLLASQY